MYKTGLLFTFIAISLIATAQSTYKDSIKLYISNYVEKHEVVKGDDRKKLHFFTVDPAYRVTATFEKKENSSWFLMPTSGPIKKFYRVYGVVHFTLKGNTVQLNIYQSQDLLQNAEYKNYLFLPFTDGTTGNESYHGGRYIDITMENIKNNQVVIDFNKAYNPYCAYVTGRYNCPIPPKENHLPIAIEAGEKGYTKQ
jgi:uncharacterized protein